MIGQVVDHYRIDGWLGSGSTAAVWRAHDLASGRDVALKLLKERADELTRVRFREEAERLLTFEHAHVLRVHAVGDWKGCPYVAMLHARGGDLRKLLSRETSLGPTRAVALLGGVAEALDAAHEHGLVHGDVKPGNILLGDPVDAGCGQVYLSDFAGVGSHKAAAPFAGEGFVGTCAYAAPEQLEGRPVDGRADVYALACVLYECIVGERPFRGADDDPLRAWHLRKTVPRVGAAMPGDWRALDRVITRALSWTPAKRYRTCTALMADAARAVAASGAALSAAAEASADAADELVPVNLRALRDQLGSPAGTRDDARPSAVPRVPAASGRRARKGGRRVGHALGSRGVLTTAGRLGTRGLGAVALSTPAALIAAIVLVAAAQLPLGGGTGSHPRSSGPGGVALRTPAASPPATGPSADLNTTPIPVPGVPSPPPTPSPPGEAVRLAGAPVARPLRLVPAVAVSPAGLSFDGQRVSTSSAVQQVTLTNTGSAALHVRATSLAGPNPSDFGIALDSCAGAVVAPGASCTVAVQFAPGAGGTRQATLVVSDDAGPGQSVGLSGTGTQPAAQITWTPTSPNAIDFGTMVSTQTNGGSTSQQHPARYVQISNTGTADLHLQSISIAGANPGEFGMADTCSGETIAPGAHCTFLAWFQADYPGTYNGLLVFTDDAGGGGQTVAVTGSAT